MPTAAWPLSMQAKKLKVSDGGFCGDLCDRWARVKMCHLKLSSSGCQLGCQSGKQTHSQSDSQTVHGLVQTYLFLTTCKCREATCNACPHRCPVCGQMASYNDQPLLSSDSQTLAESNHACVDCMLLLVVATLNTTLNQGELSHGDHHICPDMTQAMEWCLIKGNQYLAYATCKCALSAVVADILQVDELQSFLEKLLQEMCSFTVQNDEGQTDWRAAGILDLFQKLLGSANEDAQSISVHTLQKHWTSLASGILQPPDSQISPVSLHAFLSLWKKLLTIPSATARFLEEGGNESLVLLQYVTCVKTTGYVRLETVRLLNKLVVCEMECRGDSSHSCKIADRVVRWIQTGMLSGAVCTDHRAGFGWTLADHLTQHSSSADILFKRKLGLLCLRTISFTLSKHRSEVDGIGLLKSLLQFLPCGAESSPSISWLKDLFSEQDDDWVTAMLFVMDIHVYLLRREAEDSAKVSDLLKGFNVHGCFRQFVETMSHDHTVLVDLLSSPETQFLLFLLRYLKLVNSNWEDFVEGHNELGLDAVRQNQTFNSGDGQKESYCQTPSCPEGDCKSVEARFMGSSSLEYGDVTAIGAQMSVTQHRGTSSGNQLSSSLPPKMNMLETSTLPGINHATGSLPTSLSSTSLTQEITAPERNISGNTVATVGPSESPLKGPSYKGSSQTQHILLSRYSSELTAQELVCDSRRLNKDLSTQDKTLSISRKYMKTDELNCEDKVHDSNINRTDGSFGECRNLSSLEQGSLSNCTDSSAESSVLSHHRLVSLNSVNRVTCDAALDQIMGTLIRLRFGLERLSSAGLFPYNARPLLKVLQACEDRYETMNDSEFSLDARK